jgi:hypothetical protein
MCVVLLLQVGLVMLCQGGGDGTAVRKNVMNEPRCVVWPSVRNATGINKPPNNVKGGLVTGTNEGLRESAKAC